MNNKEEEWCFFKELGESITRWALIEHELWTIAVLVLKPADRFILWDAFTGIENFRSKLAFVDRSIHRGLADKSLKTEWENLVGRITTASTQRNQLVHRICLFYPQSKTGGKTISLEPSFRKNIPVRNKPEPPNDAFCVAKLSELNYGFLELFAALVVFAHKIAGKEQALPVGPALPPDRPKTFRDLARRMREELSLPQKPSAPKRAAKKP